MRTFALLFISILAVNAAADDVRLTLLEASCIQDREVVQKTLIATSARQISPGPAMHIEGKAIEFTGAQPPKNSSEEYKVIGAKKFALTGPVSVDCPMNDLKFRVLGRKQRLTLNMLFEVLPFQDGCIDQDLAYKNCNDQRIEYRNALTVAKEQGKLVLFAYGYSGCSWCDSLNRILNYSYEGDELKRIFLIKNLVSNRAANRTAQPVVADLEARVSAGLPTIYVVNPETGQVGMLDLEKYEFDDDYHRATLIARILILGQEVSGR
jgi:hypothetical protein